LVEPPWLNPQGTLSPDFSFPTPSFRRILQQGVLGSPEASTLKALSPSGLEALKTWELQALETWGVQGENM